MTLKDFRESKERYDKERALEDPRYTGSGFTLQTPVGELVVIAPSADQDEG
jgi:hypothetical protein